MKPFFLLFTFLIACASTPKIKRIEKTKLINTQQNECDQGNQATCVTLAKRMLGKKEGDTQKAISLLKKACEEKNVEGCFIFGQLNERGIGIPQDLPAAVRFYRFACEAQHPEACNNLALILRGTGEDQIESKRLLKQGCEKGDGMACFNIAFAAERKKDWDEARLYYQKSCDANFAEGCTYLGVIYRHGRGVPPDLQRGAELYRKACEGNNWIACNSMGYLFQIGSGVKRNLKVAEDYFTKACKGKLVRGCTNVGVLTEATNKKKASEIYRASCNAGDAKGCSRLGVLLLLGAKSVKKDPQEALKSFASACEKKYGPGCCNAGVIEQDGMGKKNDFLAAQKYYKQACELGEYKGCHNLGVMYAEGLGQDKNLGEAADQFMIACENGYTESCVYIGKKWMEIDEKKSIGLTLVQNACKEGNEKACKHLKKKTRRKKNK